MRKVLLFVVLMMFGASMAAVTAPPANAGTLCETFHQCGDFHHDSPDAGFDDPIPVTCNLGDPWSNYRNVPEGGDSSCHDSDAFWVAFGKNVSCYIGGEWIKFTATGWHKFNDSENRSCVHGLD